ncbi:MAG TPA: Gfo/Idh/MocA family oxidoreductase, partial [Nocardioides sp.]|nr:Gfo/Idh/MocA family oxidoreductase [Nocardioides sp.]
MTESPRPTLRVAMVGHAFMGNAHSQAWRTAPRFFDLPLAPEMSLVVGHDAGRAAAAAGRLGWQESSADWREAVARDDIDLVDICTPGNTHAEIAIAALRAGKHVLCEKPLGRTAPESHELWQAAVAAGVVHMCGFNYRFVPAVRLAREMIAAGELGEIHGFH